MTISFEHPYSAAATPMRTLLLPTSRTLEVVKSSSILYVQTFANDVVTHHTDGQRLFVPLTLRDMMLKLGHLPFFQCHKSYAVNLQHVLRYQGDIVLTSNDSIPLARRRKRDFIQRLADYHEVETPLLPSLV